VDQVVTVTPTVKSDFIGMLRKFRLSRRIALNVIRK